MSEACLALLATTSTIVLLLYELACNSRNRGTFLPNRTLRHSSARHLVSVTVVKLSLDALLVVIMLMLACKGCHSRAAAVNLFYQWLSS